MYEKIQLMEDSKSLDHHDDNTDKKINKKTLSINDNNLESISNNYKLHENDNSRINNTKKEENKLVENQTLDDKKKVELKSNINENNINLERSNVEIIKEKTPENDKSTDAELNSDITTIKSAEDIDKTNKVAEKEKKLEENKKVLIAAKSNANADKNNKVIPTSIPVKAKIKPVKEPPIEKKPFLEFVNDYLIPQIKNEFKLKGKEVNEINLQKTHRPIAEDICWVIYCEVNDTCNFWLSFEKDDITSLKSFSLCKNYEKPSIIESFLIDEKKITLKLIISRILQRLNGQKLIGAN